MMTFFLVPSAAAMDPDRTKISMREAPMLGVRCPHESG
jgi:hypothetical protein